MQEANYKIIDREVKGIPFVMIEQTDPARPVMSVTNYIHKLIEFHANLSKQSPCDFNVIYKDTEGWWDGYVYATKQFIPLRERHWLKAAVKFINKD